MSCSVPLLCWLSLGTRYSYFVLFKVLLYALVKSLSTSDLAIELELTLYWRTSAHCSFTVVVSYVSRSNGL